MNSFTFKHINNYLITAVFIVTTNQAYAIDVEIAEIQQYQRADYSRTVTECDRIGAHPSDPEKVGTGIEREQMDIEKVIAACTHAVTKDPKNPRLNYQLARAYGYSGRHVAGDAYRQAALRAGYPQSLFVVGYIRISGWDGRPAEPCYGGELVRLSALAGRKAGLTAYPHYVLDGTFSECEKMAKVDLGELQEFLEQAKLKNPKFYHRLLIENLEKDIQALQRK